MSTGTFGFTGTFGQGGVGGVLVVEGDRLSAEIVARRLRQAALAADVVLDGDAALERVEMTRYDVVVLNRDLPEVLGDEVCRAAVERWQGAVRVLMTTAARWTCGRAWRG